MTAVVAIGDERRLGGYVLAGAELVRELPAEEALVVLTHDAYLELRDRLEERRDLIWVVLP